MGCGLYKEYNVDDELFMQKREQEINEIQFLLDDEQCGIDKKHALYLECSNCSIYEYPGNDHLIALTLRNNGKLTEISLVKKEIYRTLKKDGHFICVDSLNHNPIYRLNRFFNCKP